MLPRLYIACDAHLREANDIYVVMGAFTQVGRNRRQILLDGAFLAAHLHQAQAQVAHGASPPCTAGSTTITPLSTVFTTQAVLPPTRCSAWEEAPHSFPVVWCGKRVA